MPDSKRRTRERCPTCWFGRQIDGPFPPEERRGRAVTITRESAALRVAVRVALAVDRSSQGSLREREVSIGLMVAETVEDRCHRRSRGLGVLDRSSPPSRRRRFVQAVPRIQVTLVQRRGRSRCGSRSD